MMSSSASQTEATANHVTDCASFVLMKSGIMKTKGQNQVGTWKQTLEKGQTSKIE